MSGSSGAEPDDYEQLAHEVDNIAQGLARLSELTVILGEAPDPLHHPT